MSALPFRPGQPVRVTLNGARRPAEVVCDMPEGGEVRIRVGGVSRTVPRASVERIGLCGDAWAPRHAGDAR